ncbi:MAG: glycine cleavage system protein GcvH [Anaerovoracaceae bacterium]|jgi:glycine cleavage system H protein|nr:glycine cleavage system protein GcvH [Anaerovoracaceae bacterium]
MEIKKELKYTKSHEWVKVDGDKALIGITDFAQSHMGDIVFLDLPKDGDELTVGGLLGVVESVKAAADVYSPLSGTVDETNTKIVDDPSQINRAPYESWFVKLVLKDLTELDQLLDSSAYEEVCRKEK